MNILELSGSTGLRRFVAAPWSILDADAHPAWIPPLRMSVRSILDPKTNPLFRSAERALFLAEEDGRPVGRVAAVLNRQAAAVGRDPGFVGFFESVDDQEVATTLLSTAEAWLKERGSALVTGPVSPSTNYEGGVLVEGFEHPQTFMTPWNPPYYAELFGAAGYEKGADLLAWHLALDRVDADMRQRLDRVRERVRAKLDLTVGPIDFRHFDSVMHGCWEVYGECWKQQWGYVPLSFEEWLFIAHELKPLMVPEESLAVYHEGEIVAFGLFLPDYGRAMAADRSGRLLPLNWLRLLRARRRSNWSRVMLVGVLPRFRRMGGLSLLLGEAFSKAADLGAHHVEASWVLEDNDDLNPVLRGMGGEVYRVWRVFQKRL